MAEPDIKSEPRSRASTESEPVADDIKQYPSTLQVKGKRSLSVAPKITNTTTPAWRHCTHLSHAAQIEIKEQAVKDAAVCLRDITQTLKLHYAQVTSSQKWLQRIETIRKDKLDCRVLIGFIGVSGAGKSSLINAILGLDDLLPADDEKACTAAPVEISQNHDKDTSKAFTALIERVSEDEWRVELEALYQDVSDKADNKDGEDGEPDLERDLRIKSSFQKLRCVYPHVNRIEDLRKYSVESFLTHPNVRDILGKSEHLSDPILDGFAAKIKSFIDSSSSKGEGGNLFAQWPLVKVVRLLVKSDILKHGVVLVDLPGSMDTNLACGAIAESYQQNLKVTCVVAPTERAVSDKPAQDLLGRATQRTLRLDDRFSSESLCFIVSKTDSSLNIPRYIRTHPNVEVALSDEFEMEARFNGLLNEAKEYCAERKEAQTITQALLNQLSMEYMNMPQAAKLKVGRPKKRKRDDKDESSGTSSNTYHPNSSTPLIISQLASTQPPTKEEQKARKAYDALVKKSTQANNKYAAAGNDLSKGQEAIRYLEDTIKALQSRKTAACIRNRNEVSTDELRKDYQIASKQMGQHNTKPLQVFCVSALAFTDMAKGSANVEGFLKLSDTGIPPLQRWLNETTLRDRERHAVAYLEDVVSLELSIAPWIADTSADFKMAQTQIQNLENAFDKHFNSMLKSISETNSATVRQCETLVATGIYSKMSKYENTATRETERTVKGWAQKPIHWSTHRALNRNKGEWRTHSGRQIDWNDDLAGSYLEPLITQWTQVIHDGIPDVRCNYDSNIAKLIEKFVKSITTSTLTVCPELAEAAEQWKGSMLRIPIQIRKHSYAVFNDKVQDVAREAHRAVKPKIRDGWTPVYVKCGNEYGTGHFKRNQLAHVVHAQKNARKMYKKGSQAIKAAFEKLFKSLPSEFGEGTTPSSAQVKDEFQTMVTNHTRSEETSETKQCAAKIRLQQDIQASFAKLKVDWAKKIELPADEEEVDPKPEDVDLDDLLNPCNGPICLLSDSEEDDDDEMDSTHDSSLHE
ncbi:Nuclear GTPase SLIP-GC [Lachnellula occidentalis]|uniref:Nuclear GTPase SLIP-GC n=1 Tax=Lachnellula occidentalis TaxID=215460 RepID=A0A8H8RVD7_9HELO|nr:Nuclear GTPase SLIP-GC [Lachnellula occidentalis]